MKGKKKMKKLLALTLFVAVASLSAQTQTPAKAAPAKAPAFRKVKLMNADYMLPAAKGIMGWKFQGAAFAGDMELVTEGKDKALKITPKETAHSKSTKHKTLRAICQNASPFRVMNGDTVKFDVEFKGEPGSIIGFILFDGRINHWVKWQVKCNGKWQKGSYTMKMKKDCPKSFFAADVFHKSVLLKPVKVSVQKAVK